MLPFLPILLLLHVVLAVSLFVPSLVLPFLLRARQQGLGSPGLLARALLWLQGNGTFLIGAGLALTGLGLVAALGTQLFSQPWLLVALAIYAANLTVAFFIQRPGLRALLGAGPRDVGGVAQERWVARARRQRYVSYLMAGAVGIIAFLMSTKPQF